mgnify:CR=1 FL=1
MALLDVDDLRTHFFTRDGVVRAVHVAVGEMVTPGRALLEIER